MLTFIICVAISLWVVSYGVRLQSEAENDGNGISRSDWDKAKKNMEENIKIEEEKREVAREKQRIFAIKTGSYHSFRNIKP